MDNLTTSVYSAEFGKSHESGERRDFSRLSTATQGRHWAIAVGANGYRNLRNLRYAEGDAAAIVSFFTDDLGSNKEQIYYFSDNSHPIPQDYGPAIDSTPTYSTLRRFLRVRFEHPFVRSGDTLWFFFAGHGCRYQDRDYLMPMDADPGDIANTAIPLSYVVERLRRSGADNIILLIDACRNGSDRSQGGIGQEHHQGVITLFSCSPQEASYEIEALQQGVFTHVLLDSLRQRGLENCATVERLYHRLCQRVPQVSDRYGYPPQHPHGAIEPPPKLHLILLPHHATATDVKALKFQATLAELKHQTATARETWIQVLAVAPADVDAIEGIERLVKGHSTSLPDPASPATAEPLAAASAWEQNPLPTYSFQVVTLDALGCVAHEEQGQAYYWRESLGTALYLDMVVIPPGEFWGGLYRGDVAVESFLMGKYPVTQGQWRWVAQLPQVARSLDSDPAYFKGDTLPVEQVSWQDAQEFCARLSHHTGRCYGLPTDAQWEYACRAGTRSPFHFGDTITTDWANYRGTDSKFGVGNYNRGPKGCHRGRTTVVGSCQGVNGFGLYDMHGNVWEWCQDIWLPDEESVWDSKEEEGDTRDRPGAIFTLEPERILRGGSWFFQPRHCRSGHRNRGRVNYRLNSIGFRVVCPGPIAL